MKKKHTNIEDAVLYTVWCVSLPCYYYSSPLRLHGELSNSLVFKNIQDRRFLVVLDFVLVVVPLLLVALKQRKNLLLAQPYKGQEVVLRPRCGLVLSRPKNGAVLPLLVQVLTNS